MKKLVFAGLSTWTVSAMKAEITPTEKVVNMLSDMQAKGEKMLDEEAKMYATYAEWVDDRVKDLGFEIKEGTAKIEELVTFIEKTETDIKRLGDEIQFLNGEIEQLEGEKKVAIDTRASENAEYQKISQDYAESVDALARAKVTVKAQNFSREQAAMLLQTMAKQSTGISKALSGFSLDKSSSALRGTELSAPAVAAYESQTGGIFELFDNLHDEFSDQLREVERAETEAKHNFQLLESHLTATIEKDTSDRNEKKVALGKKQSASAKAKGELAQTRDEKAADEELVSETKATFSIKTEVYKENQKVRKQEIEALGKAVEIMSSPEASGSYKQHINLVQSFVQVRRSSHGSGVEEAVALLTRQSERLHSNTLAGVVQRISANPFNKVIGMIEGMIAKLKQEAAAEANHKQWCDEQLKANKIKRKKKSAHMEALSAEIDEQSATIADQAKTIKRLLKEQADLSKAMIEATDLRTKEKAENEATIADAAAGIDAVSRAQVVLKEFYSGQSGTSFAQQVPEMKAYKGMQSGKTGVIGMLEVIESDFSRLKAETEASETAAAQEYDRFMKKSQDAKKAAHEEEFQLTLDKDQVEFEKEETTKELRGVTAEHAQATKYFDFLKPSCLEVKVDWKERAAQREEEIESLKEAYNILDQKSKE